MKIPFFFFLSFIVKHGVFGNLSLRFSEKRFYDLEQGWCCARS